jgi:hypothetical protein
MYKSQPKPIVPALLDRAATILNFWLQSPGKIGMLTLENGGFRGCPRYECPLTG